MESLNVLNRVFTISQNTLNGRYSFIHKAFPLAIFPINIYRIRGLPVFIVKNGNPLKRRKYKGFCVFLVYRMLIVALKYGENKEKNG